MDFSNYPLKVKKRIECIVAQEVSEPETCAKLCQELIFEGKKTDDSYLLGFGYYYLAEAYLELNDYKCFSEYLNEGIGYQKEAAQWELLARSYNLMGTNAASQGNITVALDQYLLALKIGEQHGCEYEVAMIYDNLGQLYMKLEEFERAIYYFLKAETLFQKFQSQRLARRNLILMYTLLGRCYLKLERKTDAEEVEYKIRKWMQGEELASMDLLSIQSFFAQLRHIQGRTEERERYIEQILEKMDSIQIVREICEDILCFADFLLGIGKYEEVRTLFQKLKNEIAKIQLINLKTEILRLKVRYYKERKERTSYLQACAELYECREIQDKENLAMLRQSAELRFRLEEAKGKEKMLLKETSILRERAETDELTGLPNRYRLREYAEEAFEKAYREQKKFGIEIFDIDHFKQYNDGYGHQKGDECLKAIGEELIKMMEEEKDTFCARYGGDEFVIIYDGKSDEEILHQAVQLRKRILKRRILHDYSPTAGVITISQGIHNTVPHGKKNVWDYLYSADGALYQVKQQEKNSVCMKYEKENESVDTVVLISRRKNDI